MTSDEEYMQEALELAKKGLGSTSPNPAVGCLIVKNKQIVGRGFHEKAGEPHAEVNALEDAGEDAIGAVMYVTLEPCCHKGRTGPCTDAIINSGVARVVVATQDPNKKVCGRGLAELHRAGVRVQTGILEKESTMMNEAYEKFVTSKEPFVIVKAALSADGKLSANDGSSKWITGEEARKAVHELRGQVDAVMVGIETVLKDNPHLTCRVEGKNPKRVIVDSKLRSPYDSNVLDNSAETIIATTINAPVNRIEAMKTRGLRVIVIDGKGEKVDLRRLLKELASEDISSIMIEGGGELIGSALDAKLVDKVMLFIAPKLLGGTGTTITGQGIDNIKNSIYLEKTEMKKVGEDFLLTGYPKK